MAFFDGAMLQFVQKFKHLGHILFRNSRDDARIDREVVLLRKYCERSGSSSCLKFVQVVLHA